MNRVENILLSFSNVLQFAQTQLCSPHRFRDKAFQILGIVYKNFKT